jgi:hypothetical protein
MTMTIKLLNGESITMKLPITIDNILQRVINLNKIKKGFKLLYNNNIIIKGYIFDNKINYINYNFNEDLFDEYNLIFYDLDMKVFMGENFINDLIKFNYNSHDERFLNYSEILKKYNDIFIEYFHEMKDFSDETFKDIIIDFITIKELYILDNNEYKSIKNRSYIIMCIMYGFINNNFQNFNKYVGDYVYEELIISKLEYIKDISIIDNFHGRLKDIISNDNLSKWFYY